jgi:hypothetical protein
MGASHFAVQVDATRLETVHRSDAEPLPLVASLPLQVELVAVVEVLA